MVVRVLAFAVVVFALVGCGDARLDRTDATPPLRTAVEGSRGETDVERFAYRQMKWQSRKTCRIVPRKTLARAFADASDDAPIDKPAALSDSHIALLFAEDVGISPIPLQRAAYDGCIEGLAARRR